MRPIIRVLLVGLLLGGVNTAAAESRGSDQLSERERAFGDDDWEDASDRDDPATTKQTEASSSQRGQLEIFELDRGFYVSSDFGFFVSLGGENGRSDAQPFLALHAGLDLNDHLGVQLSLTGAYVADNPVSSNELLDGGQGVESFQLVNVGAELVGSLRPTQRLALEPKLGGGLAYITPALTDPGNPDAVLSSANPQLTYGLDITYLTLLTGFSAGLSLTGTYVFAADILGFGVGLHVRYTL